MARLLCLLIRSFVLALTGRRNLAAENLVLQHQLAVIQRKQKGKIRLRGADRAFLIWISRIFPDVRSAIVVVKPETVIRWHRQGFRAFWRWKSRSAGGRPKVNQDLRALILRMAAENPLWGAPRIHGELLKLGFTISQSTVSKYLRRRPRPGGQFWKTYISNHRDVLAAVDLFVVPTVGFKLLYGIAVIHLKRRELVWVNATYHPTAEWIARQITEAFPWERTPRYLLRDQDASYGAAFKKRIDAMGIRDRPVAPRSPWQNGYVERVIGSIQRECLDHIIILGESHLRRVLQAYAQYYNTARTHLSLEKDAPLIRAVNRVGEVTARPHLGGLHHEYVRME
tara:strand:- start:1740 stop:2759 length:1020 start_codon:yes stop_codon:yes gene_type:complete